MPAGRFKGGQLNPLNQFTPATLTRHPLQLLNPLFIVRRNALYRGMLGGNRGWMVVWFALFAPILIRKLLGQHAEHVAIEPMAVGHVLRLEVLPQDTKLQRKAFRRTR
ncbi:MAG: hypothetical protein QM733_18535 [Ilumatobacteraceae bacterium]